MTHEQSFHADLHSHLWASLRQVLNTDLVLLVVTYAINAFGFVLIAATVRDRPVAAAIAVAALITLTGLIMLQFANSRREVLSLLRTLIQLYADHDAGRYFDESKLVYYRQRYTIRLVLAPALMVFAIALGLALGWPRPA
jgi:hypothetical protein